MITTAGREMLKQALPPGSLPEGPIDSKALRGIFTRIAKESPDSYVDTIQRVNDLGRSVTTHYGGEASVSLTDLIPPPEVAQRKAELKGKVRKIMEDSLMPREAKHEAIKKLMATFSEGSDAHMLESLSKRGPNAFVSQIKAGARGKLSQLGQLVVGDGSMPDASRRVAPWPGIRGYGEGVDPLTYWLATPATRGGLLDVQFKTGQSGYLGKQATNVAHRLVVTSATGGDPDEGLVVKGSDPDNVGAVLARPVAGLPAGTMIKDDHLALLGDNKIVIKSPVACTVADGIPADVAGLREHGKLATIGEAVGINAVRSFIEATTQAGLGSKHTGAKIVKGGDLEGFKEIEQFMHVPKEFVGGSVLARKDGRVGKVMEAPQGGWYVMVDNEQHHIPVTREVTAKEGDTVEAGDTLSDGTPNPAEIAQYKGIGEGRRYFLNKFADMLKRNGASTGRRNLELFSRAFISKVRINQPEGWNGYLPDDVVDYERIASKWEPREGSETKPLSMASGKYLEKPYLHYTIGTRVTPKVAAELNEFGHSKVLVHNAPPPFEPVVVRSQDLIRHDPDWVTRLGGENLKRALLDSAQRGGTSEKNSTSYFPRLVGMGSGA